MRARRIIEQELCDALCEEALEDVKLLVSELVTNGVRYGSRDELDLITLEVIVNGKVRCTVGDHGAGFAMPMRPDTAGGWGLKLVERLASRWGLIHSREGTKVWFEAPVKPEPSKARPVAV